MPSVPDFSADYETFDHATHAFYQKELSVKDYKGISGGFGSYAERGALSSMLRLRMPGGCISREKLSFMADAVKRFQIQRVHFTTCQTVQLHGLSEQTVLTLAHEALAHGIITRGGGGDFPRNVTVSPLSGVSDADYFDVLPWALVVSDYLMGFVDGPKMPRKLKVGFSGGPKNATHATYRDLGFAARPDGTFDVYSAGGLGQNPRFGVKVAEAAVPENLLYYVKAMYELFRAHGNYENRGKARTRYMQESLGGPEKYQEAFVEQLKQVQAEEQDSLRLDRNEVLSVYGKDAAAVLQKAASLTEAERTASPCFDAQEARRISAQLQHGLYAVSYHPIGGSPSPDIFQRLLDATAGMQGILFRLTPEEGLFILNLTAAEAKALIAATPDSAQTLFETSVACIGASICQQGLRDSQAALHHLTDAMRAQGFADGILPQIHISGCPSSCGTHQTGVIGLRGAAKVVDKKPKSAFLLTYGGDSEVGKEKMGAELGVILEDDLPAFFTALGTAVSKSGLSFADWALQNPNGVAELALPFLG